jgi:hypothetical protein
MWHLPAGLFVGNAAIASTGPGGEQASKTRCPLARAALCRVLFERPSAWRFFDRQAAVHNGGSTCWILAP